MMKYLLRKSLMTAVAVLFCFFIGTAQNPMKVHVIDVGQGSAALLEFPCGVVLVDVGGEQNAQFESRVAINQYLEDFFISRPDLNKTIDLLVLTHPHIDHTRSVKDIFGVYAVKNIITNGMEYGSGRYGQIHIHKLVSQFESTPTTQDDIGYWEAMTNHIPASGITNGIIDPIDCDGVDPIIRLLWGRVDADPGWGHDGYGGKNFDDSNNHSVVIRVDYGESSIMLSGDLEEEAIESFLAKYESFPNLLDIDLYVVGHHGSRNGSTEEFIDAMSPEVAVLSFGDHTREGPWTAWAYGHPNMTIIDMLEEGVSNSRKIPIRGWIANGQRNFFPRQVSKAIYGTGWDGDIVFEASFDGSWVYVPDSPEDVRVDYVNVNSASRPELESLPSIGVKKAESIVKYRKENGSFKSVDDLDRVPGIGPATIARIRPLIML